MNRWPWFTAIAAVVLAFSPLGQDFIYSAFMAGEQLTRNIARPILFGAMTVLVALAVLEWWIRRAARGRKVEH